MKLIQQEIKKIAVLRKNVLLIVSGKYVLRKTKCQDS